jgi:hypothetical protein
MELSTFLLASLTGIFNHYLSQHLLELSTFTLASLTGTFNLSLTSLPGTFHLACPFLYLNPPNVLSS